MYASISVGVTISEDADPDCEAIDLVLRSRRNSRTRMRAESKFGERSRLKLTALDKPSQVRGAVTAR